MIKALLFTGLLLLTGLAPAAQFPLPPSDIGYPFNTVVFLEVLDGSGTGIVIDHKDGKDTCHTYVLTAGHIVTRIDVEGKPRTIPVVYANKYFLGKVVRISAERDIALLDFEDPACLGTPIAIAQSFDPPAPVLAVAFPYGVFVISTGWASVVYEDFAAKPGGPFLVHSAPFGPGSSGSPVINQDLELVGMTIGGQDGTVALAIPLEQIRGFLYG